MGLFRRRREETLNEQLLREAGLERPEQEWSDALPEPVAPEPLDPYAGTYPADEWLGAVQRAMARPGVWDHVLTVDAPQLPGDTVEFATLPKGDVIVDVEQGDTDLSPLADAVEQRLEPPYRVRARRQDGDLWTVAARQIDVVELPFDGGDELELVRQGDSSALRVDGEPWSGEIPQLERAGASLGDDFVVQAERLDGDLWEVRVSAL
jgi:hypothetical protein